MKALSWEVFQSTFKDVAYGQFRLAWGASLVTIHTLDQTRPNCDYEYLEKLDKLIDALKTFTPIVGTTNQAAFREWLNPLDTSATGSVAYHYDVESTESIIYFELASCDDKIRIYPHHFPAPQLKNMVRCLDNIRVELVNHRATYVRLMKQIESVKIGYTEQKQVA
ncbi:hypothetical protein pEaSNUABM22_00063 [Erwinia phage pEa_SNUABM_22]|uniref:Uncharacterized protein n=1 Tax=Erwinia phage pEa_SNUABM_22 TaxID=2869549 RepID=A0AAE9BUV4_9CAUD|nr:hypothetical protein MPK63_gp063 [Erwinia phage pEa_SNUABM_22]UAW96551.1 hypothetical protein pEaSNUABM22_00063 [Erwinia phage pEa_SNUABM_22]